MTGAARGVAPAWALVLLTSLPSPSQAQTPTSTLEVRVVDPEGRPLAAEVVLRDASAERRLSTDASGWAVFFHLAPSRYRLSVATGEKGCAPRDVEIGAACLV